MCAVWKVNDFVLPLNCRVCILQPRHSKYDRMVEGRNNDKGKFLGVAGNVYR